MTGWDVFTGQPSLPAPARLLNLPPCPTALDRGDHVIVTSHSPTYRYEAIRRASQPAVPGA